MLSSNLLNLLNDFMSNAFMTNDFMTNDFMTNEFMTNEFMTNDSTVSHQSEFVRVVSWTWDGF